MRLLGRRAPVKGIRVARVRFEPAGHADVDRVPVAVLHGDTGEVHHERVQRGHIPGRLIGDVTVTVAAQCDGITVAGEGVQP